MIALALALTAEAAERRYALIVGENAGFGPDLPLRYAERDAGRMAELLQSLGGVPAANLVLLQGTDAAELRAAFADLRARVAREAAPDDRTSVFVYYSGHADAHGLRVSGTDLPLTELRTHVLDLPADLRVLVLDACQAGEILRAKGAAPIEPFPISVPGAGPVEGFAVITAAAAGEDAQESDRLQGGVFTHHLLAGLSGAADTSGDHRVSLQEAWRYAHARTLATTSRAPVVQHPSFSFDLQGQTEVSLTTLDGARRTGRLVLAEAGLYVIFDLAETRLVAEVEVPAGGSVALPAGEYRIRRRMPDRVDEGTVSVRTGEATVLTSAGLRSQPYGQSARRGETSQAYAAWGVTVGGGVMGPLLDELSVGPLGAVGVRVDLPWLSVVGRGRYTNSTATNEFLSLDQRLIGGDVVATRMFDLGPTSFGLGVGGGLAGVWQTFETEGEAAPRSALTGWVGPVARAELALLPRVTLGVEGAWDIHVVPTLDGNQATAVPRGTVDVTTWLR